MGTFSFEGSTMLAGGSNCVYASIDEGANWQKIANQTPGGMGADKVMTKCDEFYVGNYYGLFYSPDKGKSWREITGGIRRDGFLDDDGDKVMVKTIRAFVLVESALYLGASTGVFVSTNIRRKLETIE